MAWLDDEVDLVSTTDLVVADATLSGPWVEGVADYAFGYQYRGFSAAGDPNDAGDIGYRIPRPGGLRVGYARPPTRTRSMRTRRTPSARRRSGRRWRPTGPPSRHCAAWA